MLGPRLILGIDHMQMPGSYEPYRVQLNHDQSTRCLRPLLESDDTVEHGSRCGDFAYQNSSSRATKT